MGMALLCLVTTNTHAQLLNMKRNMEAITTREQKADLLKNERQPMDTTSKKAEDAPKEPVKEDELDGLGDFTFNGFKVIPNVKVMASRMYYLDKEDSVRKKDIYHCFYLASELFILPSYTSFEPAEYRANFFIPEISNYGIRFNVSYLRVNKKNNYKNGKNYKYFRDKWLWGGTFDLNLLSKDFRKDTLSLKKDFSTLLMHANLGTELVIPGSFISIYGGINWICLLTGRQDFSDNLPRVPTNFVFANVGLRTEVNLTANNNTLALDLGFIGQSGQVSDFVGNQDIVIPQIRIGFRHSLLSNPKLKND